MKNRCLAWLQAVAFFVICMMPAWHQTKCFAIDDIKNRYVFIAYSYDDLFSMIPIVDQLQGEGEIPQILALGPAGKLAREMTLGNKYYIHTSDIVNDQWEVDDILKAAPLKSLVARFPKATYVISGCAALVQGQLLELFSASCTTFAYWHNLNTQGFMPPAEAVTNINNEDPVFATALEVQSHARILLTSSSQVAKDPLFQARDPATIKVVGNPLFDIWAKKISQLNRSTLQKEIRLSPQIKTFLLVAESQDRAYDAFIEALALLKSYSATNACQVLVYPNTENDTILNSKIDEIRDAVRLSRIPSIQILEYEKKLSSMESIALADVVIDYNAPFALYALCAGKPVFHVMPADDPYTNILIQNGLSQKISSSTQFMQALQQETPSKDIFTTLSIPQASSKLFIKTLKER